MPSRQDRANLWDTLGTADRGELQRFVSHLRSQGRPLWQRSEVLAAFGAYRAGGGSPGRLQPEEPLEDFLGHVLELLLPERDAAFVLRLGVGRTAAAVLHEASGEMRPLGEEELLSTYERVVAAPGAAAEAVPVRIDFRSLYDEAAGVATPEEIGRGLEVLRRRTVERLDQSPAQRERILLTLLGAPARRGRRVLIDPDQFVEPGSLAESLRAARGILEGMPDDAPADQCASSLRRLGLEPGWGGTAAGIRQSLELLAGLLEAPSAEMLAELLPRLPLLERVVIVSPHGWFGQENVLGRPDTGGQIVYILDQVRGLEQTLRARLEAAGLEASPRIVVLTRQILESEGTTCHEAREAIRGTAGGTILRLPFLDERGQVLPRWMSRFEVWPYLHGFAERAARELRRELGGEPDLVIGNYSDGNLVAALLAGGFGATLCTIAHALEKTKYPQADLRWERYEDQYHFSIQLLADLVAVNAADFVVASTFQEIAGDEHSPGQYEAHRGFTLPGLYRVSGGIDPAIDKFNIVPPGVDEAVFFPHTDPRRAETEQPGPDRQERPRALERLLFQETGEEVYGALSDPARTPLLTLARLDRTKNITGLVERFGACGELRERCNLLVIAGKIDAAAAADAEERAEIQRMYALVERYRLEGHIRWLGVHLPKEDTGELYRVVADHRGLFVQPALYEAFGLTVLEAMASGLPTFATRHGGPAEIIRDGVDGYLIDPNSEEGISGPLLRFLQEIQRRPDAWDRLSAAGIERVRERFTWQRYSRHVLDSAALYGLRRAHWGRAERRRIDAYNELLLRLFLLPRARTMLP